MGIGKTMLDGPWVGTARATFGSLTGYHKALVGDHQPRAKLSKSRFQIFHAARSIANITCLASRSSVASLIETVTREKYIGSQSVCHSSRWSYGTRTKA